MADRMQRSYKVERVEAAFWFEALSEEWTSLWSQVPRAPISLTH